MSAALLAKLRVKNPPKARESVEIVVSAPAKREDVSIRTKVVDMTKTSGIDRQEFMRNIASREVAKRDEPLPPTPAVQEKPPAPKKRKIRLKLVQEKSDAESERRPEEAAATTAAATTAAATTAAATGAEPVEKKLTIRRKTKKPVGVVLEGPASMLKIGDETLGVRVGKKEKEFTVKASSYYMNNREIFVNFMSSLFGPYKEETAQGSRESIMHAVGRHQVLTDAPPEDRQGLHKPVHTLPRIVALPWSRFRKNLLISCNCGRYKDRQTDHRHDSCIASHELHRGVEEVR